MLKNLFKTPTAKQNGKHEKHEGTNEQNEEKIKENEGIVEEEHIPELPVMSLDDFDLFETIGTGTFGKVKVCQLKKTKEIYAIKILKKKRILELNQVDHLKNEKQILTLVRDCPFFVKLLTSFKDEENIYFIMEYVQGGELFSWSKYFKGMEEKYVKIIVAEIVVAFEYIHMRNIIFRDLKPENVLIDSLGHIKITDFGFAKKLGKDGKTYTTCGTPECLAPEVILGLGQDKGVDYWALGILMYELLVGTTPFHAETYKETYQKILKSSVVYPKKISSSARDLMEKLLEKDPTARIGNLKNGINDIKNHKWFKNLKWDQIQNRSIKSPFIIEVDDESDTKYFGQYKDSFDEPIKLTNEELDLFKDF